MALSVLLAACATTPVPAVRSAASIAPNLATVRTLPAIVHASTSPVANSQGVDVWQRLRASFVMDDCDANPAALAWSHRFTRNPRRFESQMGELLPQLDFVQKSTMRHGVAGEFALLPWVESHYRQVPGRKNRPAGMWQIMPITAGSMGLRMNRTYDARMDLPASTEAVMDLLQKYHARFDDWRLADFAYNAGEFTVRHRLTRNATAKRAQPAASMQQRHLDKLLGIACVVREPARFHITLPQLAQERRLVVVNLEQPLSLKEAAAYAGMSSDALNNLNAAYRDGSIERRPDAHLVLPDGHARQFGNALLQQAVDDATNQLASVSTRPVPPVLEDTENLPDQATAEHIPKTPTQRRAQLPAVVAHTVKSGESLWQIAHRYDVDLAQLKRWNHLQISAIKPGQKLEIRLTR